MSKHTVAVTWILKADDLHKLDINDFDNNQFIEAYVALAFDGHHWVMAIPAHRRPFELGEIYEFSDVPGKKALEPQIKEGFQGFNKLHDVMLAGKLPEPTSQMPECKFHFPMELEITPPRWELED